MTAGPATPVSTLKDHVGEEVRLLGWVENRRSSGKLGFVQLRDGSGVVQCVISKKQVDESSWQALQESVQEATISVIGTVAADERSPSGVEIQAASFALEALPAEEYPISKKEHGTAFLMEHRHLWLRSSRQRAVLKVRSEAVAAIRDYFHSRDFVLIDSPILTPAACEGTSTLFETDYFGDPAF
ncbi:MAG: OB-fold nucleic acid binding domain-containing protein, partial [Acidobacteriota bacterium]